MKRTQNENVNMLACCRNSISCAPENNRSKEFAHCVCVCKKEWRILNCKHITLTHRAAIEMISQMEHNIIWNCYTQKLCCFMVEFPPDSICLSLSFRVTLHTPPPSPHINLAVIDLMCCMHVHSFSARRITSRALKRVCFCNVCTSIT